jgi:hypothetical protein
MALDTKKIKTILALTILLVSTICSAQVQYCGSDSSAKTLVNLAIWSEQVDNAAWSKGASTVSADVAIAPNGTTTADKIVEDLTNSTHRIFNASPYSLVSGVTYRFEAHLKAAERTWATLRLSLDGATHNTSINLATCALGTNAAGTTVNLLMLPNGWCSVELIRTAIATTSNNYFNVITATADNTFTYTGDGASGILVWGLQYNLSSSPSDYIATTDTQVTAGTANTLAKVTLSNLALWSEQADNAAWTKLSSSTVTPNSIAAPDGTMTADTLTAGSTTSVSSRGILTATGITIGAADVMRAGVFLKKNTNRYANVQMLSTATVTSKFVNVDLDTCTIVFYKTTGYTATAESRPNGWCEVNIVGATGVTSGQMGVGVSPSATWDNTSYTTTGTQSVYAWGMKLQYASSPPDYLPTTSAAATLGPLCPSGTSQSLNDPSRCFAVTDNRVRRW